MDGFVSLQKFCEPKNKIENDFLLTTSTSKDSDWGKSASAQYCTRANSRQCFVVDEKERRPHSVAVIYPQLRHSEKDFRRKSSFFSRTASGLNSKTQEGMNRLVRIKLMKEAGEMESDIVEDLVNHIKKDFKLKFEDSELDQDSSSDNADSMNDQINVFAKDILMEGYEDLQVKVAPKQIIKALEMEPKNVTALVARSKCYLQIGDAQAALQDAESSLSENIEFHRGLYQKAEALYQMGDFEYALVFYHRGHKLRPELQEFRLGIQKAQEAINNCVGTPQSVKLENKGDLSFFNKMDEGKKSKQRLSIQYRSSNKSVAAKTARTAKAKSGTSHRTAKALLGELYADKEYLEKLLKDEDLVKGSAGGMSIYDLVTSGINYLDTRTEFWRQQKPMYARKRDRMLMQQKWAHKATRIDDPTAYILKNLEDIDQFLAEGKAADSLQLATSTLRAVNKLSDKEIPNKADVVANLHSCIGNAYLELGQTQQALTHHQKDLDISEKYNFQDARSRALDNLGRVYARVGNFKKAISCWEEKIPLSKSALENTWLFHEIGRCYLEIGENDEKARNYGQKSYEEAIKAEDQVWLLNAGVLIAQAEVKLKMFEAAVQSFEKSLETAKELDDEDAQIAITKALDDVREKISSAAESTDGTEKDEKPEKGATEEQEKPSVEVTQEETIQQEEQAPEEEQKSDETTEEDTQEQTQAEDE